MTITELFKGKKVRVTMNDGKTFEEQFESVEDFDESFLLAKFRSNVRRLTTVSDPTDPWCKPKVELKWTLSDMLLCRDKVTSITEVPVK